MCQIVAGPQFQNSTLKCCFLTLHRALKIVECYLKNGKKIKIGACFRGECLLRVFYKSENKEKLKAKFLFFLWPGQKEFCLFWGKTKLQKFTFFQIFVLVIVLWSKRKIFANFWERKNIHLVSMIYWKWTFAFGLQAYTYLDRFANF